MTFRKLRNLICGNQTYSRCFIKDRIYYPLENINLTSCKSIYKINTICTWNVQELFYYTNDTKLNSVIKYIRTCPAELICLQEVFEITSLNKIIKDQIISEKYPYFVTGNMRSKYIFGENSGILVFSKYPITVQQWSPLDYMNFPDSFASKGVLYFSIGNKNFATTHLQSEDEEIAAYQLKNIIKNSPFTNFILLGDLNHRFAHKICNKSINNHTKTHISGRILDYIIPFCDEHLTIEVNPIDFTISDHCPLIGTIIENQN